MLNEVHLQAQQSWARPRHGMAEGDCTPQPAKEAQAGEEVFKDFFLLIVGETEGKKARGGMRSFSDCYRLTCDQMTGS